jgi:hypothetical protein
MADGYGQGTITRLLDPTTIMSSGIVQSFYTTANNTNTADILTVIVKDPAEVLSRKTLYSIDSGDTFIRGPDLDSIGSGFLYFIEINTT